MTSINDSIPVTVVEYVPLPSSTLSSKKFSLKGALCFLLGVLAYAIANVFIKTSSAYYPLGEMVVLRGLIFLIPLFLYGIITALTHSKSLFKTSHLKIHIIQGILSAFCLYFLFYAFDVMPLADATAISFAETFILTALSVFFLKEVVPLKNWGAILIGFLGVLIITQPTAKTLPQAFHLLGACACLLAVTFDSVVLFLLRKLAKTDRTATILFYYALFSTLGGLIFFPFETWLPITHDHIFDILGLGLFGALGQTCITYAFKQNQTSVLAPLIYTELLWSLVFDDLFWSTLPNRFVLLGSSLIILSGLYIIQQEKKKQKD